MDMKMMGLSCDPRIIMFLLPMPTSSRVIKDHSQDPDLKVKPPKPIRPIKKAKPSPKAKAMWPQELKGFKKMNASGLPICWAFNMASGCNESVSNGRCKKGFHECIRCNHSNHGLSSCRVAKKK